MAWNADHCDTIAGFLDDPHRAEEVFEVRDEAGNTICYVPTQNKEALNNILFIGKYLELVRVMSKGGRQ